MRSKRVLSVLFIAFVLAARPLPVINIDRKLKGDHIRALLAFFIL